jgi:nucleoside-diphosphate-sugar epimerase
MEREKILVLGSTGMIGGYLMPVLARTGMPLVGTYASHAPEVHETASKHADPELIHFDYLVVDRFRVCLARSALFIQIWKSFSAATS